MLEWRLQVSEVVKGERSHIMRTKRELSQIFFLFAVFMILTAFKLMGDTKVAPNLMSAPQQSVSGVAQSSP